MTEEYKKRLLELADKVLPDAANLLFVSAKIKRMNVASTLTYLHGYIDALKKEGVQQP